MVNLKKLKEQYEKMNSTGGDFYEKFFQMGDGEASVRFLPWDRDDREFYAESAIHRIDGKNYHCPGVENKECPLCKTYRSIWEKINRIGKDTAEGKRLQQVARGIKANSRFYLNAVDRRDGKVKILSAGKRLFSKILSIFIDEDYGDLTDLKSGWDFKIVREQVAGFPNYDKSAPRPKQTPAGSDAEIATWMEELHDIHSLIKIADYEELSLISKEIMSVVSGGSSGLEDSSDNDQEDDSDDYLKKLNSLDS